MKELLQISLCVR